MAYNYNGAGLPRMPNFQTYANGLPHTVQERARMRRWRVDPNAPPDPGAAAFAQASTGPSPLALNNGKLDMTGPVGMVPNGVMGQRTSLANSDGNVINSGFAPRPGSTPASALPKRPQSQPDRFAVNNNPAQRSIEARPVDINYMGIDPYALKQEQITESFWGGTPQVKDGSTDYMGGLINYNPKEGQTGADRMGLFGGAMQDAAAWLDGDGSSADHLSKAQARSEATRKEANTNSARERAQQMLSAAGDDVEAQREALMYGAMKGVDLSDYAAALKYGQPEYKEGDPGKDLYRVDANGRRTLVRSGISEPKISGGVQWTRENGYQKVPFWLEQQTAIARARGAARNGAGSIGVPGLGDGWAMD